LNDKPVLITHGKVSAEVGKQIALKEFDRFNDQLKEETNVLGRFLNEKPMDTYFEDEENKTE
jgi:hypothetical protein